MKPEILWASPLPPTPSGVSDYAVEIMEPLSALAALRVLRPPGHTACDLPEGVEIVDDLEDRRPGERLLLHLGNNPFHEWILPLCREPGAVAVFHDLVLHHLLVEHTAARGDSEALGTALEVEYGRAGRALARAREFGFSGRLDPFLYPALRTFTQETEAFISHSIFGLRRLEKIFPRKPQAFVPLPVADPGVVDAAGLRAESGIPESAVLLMHFGFLSREKGLETILRALAAVRMRGLPAHLLVVGGTSGLDGVAGLVSALGLENAVSATGWLERKEMMRLPAAADLGIVLREPSAGETSAAVLRFLACGTPVGVIASQQYLEWPPEVAPRIIPGPGSAAELVRLIERLASEKKDGGWEQRRARTRSCYLKSHLPRHAAESMLAFLQSLHPLRGGCGYGCRADRAG